MIWEVIVWVLDVLLLFAGLVVIAAGLVALGAAVFAGIYYVLLRRTLRGD